MFNNERLLNNALNKLRIMDTRVLGVNLMDEIRKLNPRTPQDWLEYLYVNTNIDIDGMGEKLAYETGLTLDECIRYVYSIIVDKTFEGWFRENRLLNILSWTAPPGINFRFASGDEDLQFAVDIVVLEGDLIIGGVQVKPESFKYPRCEAHKRHIECNRERNRAFGHPVYYIYYKGNRFIGVEELLGTLICI